MGYVVTRLSSDTILAVQAFDMAAKNVLEALQASYEYLLDSYEEEAIITISQIENIAQNMMETSTKLKADAANAADQVKKVVDEVDLKRGKALKEKMDSEKAKMELELQHSQRKNALKEATDGIEHLNTKVMEAEFREQKAEDTAGNLDLLAAFIPIPILQFSAAANNQRAVAQRIREGMSLTESSGLYTYCFCSRRCHGVLPHAPNCTSLPIPSLPEKQELYNELREQIANRRKVNDDIEDFSLQLLWCTTKEAIAEKVGTSLHQALSGLRQISMIMEQTREFWEAMHAQCKDLSSAQVKNMIENQQKKDEDMRHKFYRSDGFKRMGVQHYARWVALQSICQEYTKNIGDNHRNLLEYIGENPTPDESVLRVQEIAKKVSASVKASKKQLEAEDREVRQLQDAITSDEVANT